MDSPPRRARAGPPTILTPRGNDFEVSRYLEAPGAGGDDDSPYWSTAGSSFAERPRMTTIERDSRSFSGSVNVSEPANVGLTFPKLERKKVVWIVVGLFLMALGALLAHELLRPLPTLKAEGCVCPLRIVPPIKGHWHKEGGVWQCLPGVGTNCH